MDLSQTLNIDFIGLGLHTGHSNLAFLFNVAHKFSIGLRSGLLPDHGCDFILCHILNLIAAFDL